MHEAGTAGRSNLATDEIHVWIIHTTDAALDAPDRSEILDPAERARASRLRSELDRRRFVRRRVALREILARYTGVAAGDLRFTTNAWGRPELAAQGGAFALRFNTSRSGAIAVVGVSAAGRIGLDVEQLRVVDDAQAIAARFFAPAEAAALAALPATERSEAFMNAWTRKEAIVKGLGGGLSIPLDSFEVSLGPGDPASIRRWGVPGAADDRWQILSFTPVPGYVAALALDHEPAMCRCRQWPG